MHKLFETLAHDKLVWLPELDLGYYHVDPTKTPYDAAYFVKYRTYADTPIGCALNKARCDLVARWWNGPVCDIGIGDGAFLRARQEHAPMRDSRFGQYRASADDCGFDVNPAGVHYLKLRCQFVRADNTHCPHHAFTFWDSFEHIHDFRNLLAHAGQFVFMAVPTFDGPNHVLRSKHYRKDEHCWYFTTPGLLRVMDELGFVNVEVNSDEVLIGREDVRSFAFKRK